MYCSHCGQHNPDGANYCRYDGTPLTEAVDGVQLIKKEARYCASCGAAGESHHSYCVVCGTSLHVAEAARTEEASVGGSVLAQPAASVRQNVKGRIQIRMDTLKQGLIGAAAALVLAFVLVLIVGSAASHALNDKLQEIGLPNEVVQMAGGQKGLSFFGTPELLMNAHLVGSSIKLNMASFSGSLSLDVGILLFLLIPLAGLMTAGYLLAKRAVPASVQDRLSLAVNIGIAYAVLLAIVSLFAGTSKTVDVPLVGHFDFSYRYSFFGALFSGLLFGTFFSWLGTLLQLGSFKTTAHLRGALAYGESLHQAVGTLVRGIVISTVLLFVMALFNGGLKGGDGNLMLIALPQVGAYLWNVLNFGTFSADAAGSSWHASVIGGFTASDGASIAGGHLYLVLGLLIPIVLFLWAGRQIKASAADPLKALGVFSASYALMMAVLIFLLNIKIGASGAMMGDLVRGGATTVNFGFNSFLTFLFSLVVSFALSYAGSRLPVSLSVNDQRKFRA